MTANWSGLIVICGTTFWNGHRLLDQHMAEQLTQFAPVLYVDPPTSFLSRFRNEDAATRAFAPGLHHIAPGLAVWSARVPPLKERPVGKQLALRVLRASMRSAVRELGSPDVHAVVVPSLNPLFGALGERVRVFYAKDDYVAGAGLMGIAASRLAVQAERQPRDADLVVGVSPALVDAARAAGARAVLIPNGCDVAHFARTPVPDPVAPVAAMVGQLSDRVDLELLESVADRGHRLLLIGPRQRISDDARLDLLLQRPNVEWTGAVPYESLPQVLGPVTTCLLPYVDSAFNRASFPLKVLEYLAAGRRVVSSDLPSVRWLDTLHVDIQVGPEAFADAVDRSLRPLDAAEVGLRRSFASQHSWADRAATLAHELGLAVRAPGARSVA
jgi:teichuronic acid biosynthesis glycosyltransferase TuaH